MAGWNVYPLDDLDRESTTWSILGGFWSQVYKPRDDTAAFGLAMRWLFRQAREDLDYAKELVGRQGDYNGPIQLWKTFQFERADLESRGPIEIGEAGRVFDSSWLFGDLSNAEVGIDVGFRPRVLLDGITAPTRMLLEGSDFFHTDDGLLFVVDLADWGGEADVLSFYSWRSKRDDYSFWNIYGYGLKAPRSNSTRAIQAINALWDMTVLGPNRRAFWRYLGAICDCDLCLGDGEVVEAIWESQELLTIITDANVYRFHPDAEVLVEIGEELVEGQALTNVLRVAFLDGETPDWIEELGLPSGMAPDGLEAVSFRSGTVDTERSTDSNGNTIFRFDLGFYSDDFWERWEAQDVTPAQFIDPRASGSEGEVPPGMLPATVDPLDFLVVNLIGKSTTVVQLEAGLLGEDQLGLHWLELLRKHSSPFSNLIFQVVLPEGELTGEATMEEAEDDDPAFDENGLGDEDGIDATVALGAGFIRGDEECP
jgi:hypothetical protein